MKLIELEPQFLKIDAVEPNTYHNVSDIAEADGIIFCCPVCFKTNNGRVGTHSIICWRPRVPQSESKTGPGRWEFSGTCYDDLYLMASSSSILLQGGCKAHFYIREGEIRIA